jgi:hypothetical protein
MGPQLEGFPTAGEIAAANSLPVLGDLVIAAVCLFAGEALARAFFSEERSAITGLSRRDLLVTGVSLLGVSIALAGLPGVLQVVAVSLWYAEESRQAQFMATMETWWETLVNSGLALLVGGITIASAAKIASVLDARYAGGSAAGEPAR